MEVEPVHFAPILPEHLHWVIDVERRSFPQPWKTADFNRALRTCGVVGLIAYRVSCPSENLGYVVFRSGEWNTHVWNLAVAPEHRRSGVGRGMIELLRRDLRPSGRSLIRVEVRESNLAGQLFFRALRFRAVRVIRAPYDEIDEDAYRFVYRYRTPAEAMRPY